MKKLVLLAFFLLSGCSSWQLKDKCEKTNWFEYSRDVALSGRYLDEDGFIRDCKGVDRISATAIDQGFKSGRERYCTYESFFRNGESGEPVNFKMCDNLVMYQMQERYAQGLKSFCTASIGYSYGASGKVYKGVCIRRDEEKFLQPYYKGRAEYLAKVIAQIDKDSQELQILQDGLSRQISNLSNEVQSLPALKECHTESVYNSSTQKTESQLACSEPNYIRSRRDSLYSQLDTLRSQYADHGRVLTSLAKELQNNRNELTKIPTAFVTETRLP